MGMKPVLPAFAGFLPPAFVQKHPEAKVTQSADWNNFPGEYGFVYLLESVDPMFQTIGKAFIEEQTKLYSTDNIYQCDTYNEMNPPKSDLDYLAASSKAVFSAMQAGDSQAVWLMQGWLFLNSFWHLDRVRAYLSSVPNDRMVILDLTSEAAPQWTRTEAYFGKPFIWNTLHDYGGQQGLIGNLPKIHDGFASARSKASSNLEGVGITMEGMWTNYIVYDYTLSQAWGRSTTGEPRAWARRFGARRYGGMVSQAASDIWDTLYGLVYTSDGGPRSGQVASRPSMNLRPSPRGPAAPFVAVWQSLQELSDKVGSSKAYRFDLVDFGREALTAIFDQHLSSFRAAVSQKNVSAAQAEGARILIVMDDFDRLLSTDENFMLGRWLKMARSWGATPEEQRWLDWNARNQLTLWGPTGEIVDYATKSWGGLARAYFRPRWALFVKRAVEALSADKAFDQGAFNTEVLNSVEQPWQHANDTFPSEPEEDAIQVSEQLLKRYGDACEHEPSYSIAFI